jgi:hypothetical protein
MDWFCLRASPAGDSALVRDVVERGRRMLEEVVVLAPLPRLWSDDDDDDDGLAERGGRRGGG